MINNLYRYNKVFFDENFVPAQAGEDPVALQALLGLVWDEASVLNAKYLDIYDGLTEFNHVFLEAIGLKLGLSLSRTIEDDRNNHAYITLSGTGSDHTEIVVLNGIWVTRLALKRLRILGEHDLFRQARAGMVARNNNVNAVVPYFGYDRIMADLNANLRRGGRLAIEWEAESEAEDGSNVDSDESEPYGLTLDASDDEWDLKFASLCLDWGDLKATPAENVKILNFIFENLVCPSWNFFPKLAENLFSCV